MSPVHNAAFEQAVALLEAQEWIYAKTMPQNPHHYTLRKKWGRDADFVATVTYIREYGYRQKYQGRWYTQLDANGYFYWTMGDPMATTILINRKPLVYPAAYDAIAPVYDTLFQDDVSLQQNQDVMGMLGDVSGKSVLDIGCGTGLLLDYVTPAQYTGIDISKAMLDRLLAKHPARQGDVINTSLASFANGRRYDIIAALFGAASYLSAAELARIPHLLAPGGKSLLMFYAPDYHPVTYLKTGVQAQPVTSAQGLGMTATHYHTYQIIQGTA